MLDCIYITMGVLSLALLLGMALDALGASLIGVCLVCVSRISFDAAGEMHDVVVALPMAGLALSAFCLLMLTIRL